MRERSSVPASWLRPQRVGDEAVEDEVEISGPLGEPTTNGALGTVRCPVALVDRDAGLAKIDGCDLVRVVDTDDDVAPTGQLLGQDRVGSDVGGIPR